VGGGETIGSGPLLLATVDATAWAKQRRFDAGTRDTVATLGVADWADFAGFHYRVSALHESKTVPGLSDIRTDPHNPRSNVAAVSGEWADSVTRCDRVELF
jgi:hypothetical protein